MNTYPQILICIILFFSLLSLTLIILTMGVIMSGLDNLNTAINNLNTTITSVKDYVASLNAKTGDSDEAVQAAADSVNTAQASLAAILPPTA